MIDKTYGHLAQDADEYELGGEHQPNQHVRMNQRLATRILACRWTPTVCGGARRVTAP